MDKPDRIKLEAVSFETPGSPMVTFGLTLPSGQSLPVEIRVALPEGSAIFNSYNQVMALARLQLSQWLDEMASEARQPRPFSW